MGHGTKYPDGPAHEVQITKGFWIDRHEVTEGQYEDVMGQLPPFYARHPSLKKSPDFPVPQEYYLAP
jgi:formylglycine-generating enzyme required for sulfatase activity